MNGDGTGLTLHFPALAGQVVELLAVYLDGGVHGGNLENVAPEFGQDSQQVFFCQMHFALGNGLAGDVLGVGGQSEADGGLVDLLRVLEKFHAPGGTAHKDRQNAGGHGVQGAAVADAAGVEDPPQAGDHVVAGPLLGLVDDDDAVHQLFSHLSMASIKVFSATARGSLMKPPAAPA